MQQPVRSLFVLVSMHHLYIGTLELHKDTTFVLSVLLGRETTVLTFIFDPRFSLKMLR